MNEIKKCAQCGQEKPIEDFSKSYKNLCKACVAENMRVARQTIDSVKPQKSSMPSFYYGRGLEVPIPEDATFISPMRFQASVAAMQGMLASGQYTTNFTDFIAQRSVEYADALLNELKTKKDEYNM